MRRRPRACFQLFSIRWHRARAIARSTRDFLVVVDQVVLVGSGRWRRCQEWLICCWKSLAIRLLDAHWTFRLLTCSWCFHQEEIAYYTHGVNNYSLVVSCSRCKGRHDGCEFCFCFVSRTMWLKASAKKNGGSEKTACIFLHSGWCKLLLRYNATLKRNQSSTYCPCRDQYPIGTETFTTQYSVHYSSY